MVKPMVPDDSLEHSAELARPVNRWLSIRWALPTMMLLPLVTGIGLTGWLAFHSGKSAVVELVQEISGEVTNRIKQRLEGYISEINLTNNLVVANFQSGYLSSADPARVRQYLWQLVRFSSTNDAIMYSDSRGTFIQAKRLENGEFTFSLINTSTNNTRYIYPLDKQGDISGPPKIQNYDPRNRPWYKAAMTAQKDVWSEIYQSSSSPDLAVTRATPLTPSGTNLPVVIGIDVRLQSLSHFLNSLEIGKTGRAFIVERSGSEEGELVATSQGLPAKMEGTDTGGDQRVERLSATDSTDEQIRETAIELEQRFEGFHRVPEGQPIHVRHKGQTYWVNAYSFKDKNLDWLVVVSIPEVDFAARINRSAQRTLLLGGLITGAVTLLSVSLSLWLVRPIARLTRTATAIKQNRYQPNELTEVANRPDELGELAALFEDMALVVNSREQGLTDQVAALRSEIAQYGKASDEGVRSVMKVLQQSKQVRQTYDDRQPHTGQ